MSYQNASSKSGATIKPAGKSQSAQQTKSPQQTKSKQRTKAGQQSKISAGSFQAQDIKSLVHNQGRAKLSGQEWALKAPSWNDAALQAIISDPKFTAKPAGKPATDGKCTYELSGHGKTINVTIGH